MFFPAALYHKTAKLAKSASFSGYLFSFKKYIFLGSEM